MGKEFLNLVLHQVFLNNYSIFPSCHFWELETTLNATIFRKLFCLSSYEIFIYIIFKVWHIISRRAICESLKIQHLKWLRKGLGGSKPTVYIRKNKFNPTLLYLYFTRIYNNLPVRIFGQLGYIGRSTTGNRRRVTMS